MSSGRDFCPKKTVGVIRATRSDNGPVSQRSGQIVDPSSARGGRFTAPWVTFPSDHSDACTRLEGDG